MNLQVKYFSIDGTVQWKVDVLEGYNRRQ